jgi:predicted MFS family arabinose efflux permease
MAAAYWLLPEDAPPADQRTPWLQLALVLGGVALLAAADLATGAVVAAALSLGGLGLFAAAVKAPAGEHGLFPRAAGEVTSVIGAAYLSFFALSGAAMCFSVYAPALLQKLYGFTAMEAGYASGLESVGWTVAAIAVAGLSERWHPPVIRLGALCVVGSLAALAVVMRLGPPAAILAAATVLGAGFGLSSGFTARRVIAAAPGTEREVASAGVNSVRQVGNAAGACLAGIIANLLGMTAGVTTQAADAAAVWLFALSVPLALVGAVASWRVAAARLDLV